MLLGCTSKQAGFQKINYSNWDHLVQTHQIYSGFKDKNSHALVVSWCSVSHRFGINLLAELILFSLNIRQSSARRPSLLPAEMAFVAILASSRSFSPPGSLLPISYPCLESSGRRAPTGNFNITIELVFKRVFVCFLCCFHGSHQES